MVDANSSSLDLCKIRDSGWACPTRTVLVAGRTIIINFFVDLIIFGFTWGQRFGPKCSAKPCSGGAFSHLLDSNSPKSVRVPKDSWERHALWISELAIPICLVHIGKKTGHSSVHGIVRGSVVHSDQSASCEYRLRQAILKRYVE